MIDPPVIIQHQRIIPVVFCLIDIECKLRMQQVGIKPVMLRFCILYGIPGQKDAGLLTVILFFCITQVSRIHPQLQAILEVDKVIGIQQTRTVEEIPVTG
jgi:hypothetical protein